MKKLNGIRHNKLVKIFFDFYAINELYLRCGGFREQGYPSYPVFVNERIFDRIRNQYEDIVNRFYDLVYQSLVRSVKSEMRHFPDDCYELDCDVYIKLAKHGITRKMTIEAKKDPARYGEIVFSCFSIPRWCGSYGGKKWAKGAQKLIDARNVKTLQQKVAWCDVVLDLYHNTGHMLDKTEFRVLSQRIIPNGKAKWLASPLDFRYKAPSVTKFIPHLSTSIRNLVIPRKRMLEFAL